MAREIMGYRVYRISCGKKGLSRLTLNLQGAVVSPLTVPLGGSLWKRGIETRLRKR